MSVVCHYCGGNGPWGIRYRRWLPDAVCPARTARPHDVAAWPVARCQRILAVSWNGFVRCGVSRRLGSDHEQALSAAVHACVGSAAAVCFVRTAIARAAGHAAVVDQVVCAGLAHDGAGPRFCAWRTGCELSVGGGLRSEEHKSELQSLM